MFTIRPELPTFFYFFFACQFKMTRSQLGIYCLTMHRKTDVEQIEICLCLGQISLAVSGGGACGGRNGGARWRPVGGILPRFKQVFFFKKKSFISYSPKTSRIYFLNCICSGELGSLRRNHGNLEIRSSFQIFYK